MPHPRTSLSAFLALSKQNLALGLAGAQKATIVIGNESADLDSLTSSLLYAYFRSFSPSPQSHPQIYIPLVCLPSPSLFRLRPEFTTVLSYAQISPSNLLTLADFSPGFKAPENISWVLVDHNFPSQELREKYGLVKAAVRGCIDHHEDEGFVPPLPETSTEPEAESDKAKEDNENDQRLETRIITRAGSNTSLLIRSFKSTWDTLSLSSLATGAANAQSDSYTPNQNDATLIRHWDAQIAKVALASILIDTGNLSAPEKVKAVDREAVAYLETKILSDPHSGSNKEPWSCDRFHQEVSRAKEDIGGLTIAEILLKDFKMWTETETAAEGEGREGENPTKIRIGVSSTVKPLSFLARQAFSPPSSSSSSSCSSSSSPSLEQQHEREKDEDEKEVQNETATPTNQFSTAISTFMHTHNLSLFAIMTAFTTAAEEEPHFQRQLLLQALPPARKAVDRFLAANAMQELGLDELGVESGGVGRCTGERAEDDGEAVWRNVWRQGRVGMSRKQVAPLLRGAVRG